MARLCIWGSTQQSIISKVIVPNNKAFQLTFWKKIDKQLKCRLVMQNCTSYSSS